WPITTVVPPGSTGTGGAGIAGGITTYTPACSTPDCSPFMLSGCVVGEMSSAVCWVMRAQPPLAVACPTALPSMTRSTVSPFWKPQASNSSVDPANPGVGLYVTPASACTAEGEMAKL